VDSPAPISRGLKLLLPEGSLGRQSVSRETLVLAGRKILSPLVSYSFLLFLFVAALIPWHPVSGYAWDFRAFYDAGHHYLHLQSPYISATLAELTSQRNFVYPLPVAAAFAPLSLVPYALAAVLFILFSTALLCLALRILGVRDWRCYAAMLLGMPVQLGLKLGTLSPLLAFLLAVLWRYRNRTPVAVVTLAALVLAKLFLWPVALLFLFTRRARVAVLAAVLSIAVVALASIPFGLSVLTSYPGLLHAVSDFEAPFGFSVFSFGEAAGLPAAAATGLSVAAGGALLVFAFVRGRRGDDSAAFRACVVAALALSPIVWGHYLVLLFVPLAIVRPRFSTVWLASAWVWGDGFVLDEKRVWIVPGVLAVILVQAGLVDLDTLRKRLPRALGAWRSRLVVYSGLWAALLVLLSTLGNVIPTVAALEPVSAHASTSLSGTSFLRWYRQEDKLCWRVWTTGVPAGSRMAIVGPGRSGSTLAAASLDSSGKSKGCVVPTSKASYPLLLKDVKKRTDLFRVEVVAPGRKVVLSGGLQRRVDASNPLNGRGH
jgi:hypothetical protein